MAGQDLSKQPSQVRGPTRVFAATWARSRMPLPGSTGAVPQTPAVIWWEFRKSGNALTNPAVVLGVMPQGQLLNAMEIVFHEEDAARTGRAKLRGSCSYRVRQTLEERDFQFVNGDWQDWTSRPEGTADPIVNPSVWSWQPPYIRMIDTPGWSAWEGVGPNTRQLGANGVKSDINATEIWVQQQFKTWVQGEDCFTSLWTDVSRQVVWHNSLHLVRDSPNSPWHAGRNCRIDHGPMKFGAATQL